jgi:flagellar protein FlaH
MPNVPFQIERDELAQKLGGGLPRNALCVILGRAGSGKSVLCQRLAYGASHCRAKVAYVSTELGLPNFLEQMHSLGYPVDQPFLARTLNFYATHPSRSRAVPRAQQLLRLLSSNVGKDHELIIVDRFSNLLRDAQELGRGRYGMVDVALERFLAWARQGRTLVLAVDPDDITADDLGALERVADVYLELTSETTGLETLHLLHVRRFERPLTRVSDVIGFHVEPRIGLRLEIKAVYG